jgi:hypothetical protein
MLRYFLILVVFTELPLAQNEYILRFTNEAITPILKLNYYLMLINNRLREQVMMLIIVRLSAKAVISRAQPRKEE